MILDLLRALAAAAAGVWLGGMIVIAVVAQTTFSEMRGIGVDRPDWIAGQVMARNFAKFDTIQMVCAALLLTWQAVVLVAGERGTSQWLRLAAILLASGLLVYSVTVLTPKILYLQSWAGQPEADAKARLLFDDFHRSAVRVSMMNLVLVTAILFSLAWRAPNARPDEGDGRGVLERHLGESKDWRPEK